MFSTVEVNRDKPLTYHMHGVAIWLTFLLKWKHKIIYIDKKNYVIFCEPWFNPKSIEWRDFWPWQQIISLITQTLRNYTDQQNDYQSSLIRYYFNAMRFPMIRVIFYWPTDSQYVGTHWLVRFVGYTRSDHSVVWLITTAERGCADDNILRLSKMAAILQRTYSNSFSYKIVVFW